MTKQIVSYIRVSTAEHGNDQEQSLFADPR